MNMKKQIASMIGALMIHAGCSHAQHQSAAEQALLDKGFTQEWIDQLDQRGTPRVYQGEELDHIGLVVSGQYTGQVYLSGDGRLWYWDIFNRRVMNPRGSGDYYYKEPMLPADYQGVNQGFLLELTHNGQTHVRHLDNRGFDDITFRGEYPIGHVSLAHADVPVEVTLEAFSPFAPTNSADSSIPATIMAYAIENTSDEPVTLRVGGWLENASYKEAIAAGQVQATEQALTGATGVVLSGQVMAGQNAAELTQGHDAGGMALVLLNAEGQVGPQLPAAWAEHVSAGDSVGAVRSEAITLQPGETQEIRFAIAWHMPNIHRGERNLNSLTNIQQQRHEYTRYYDDVSEVAQDLAQRHDELAAMTRLWRDNWYDSTMPYWLLDRSFLNISTLATTVSHRFHDPTNELLDGRTYFWEGVYRGDGTCTHVTHYEQAFGRLFPDAARSQRTAADFGAGWDDELGYVRYRAEYGYGQHFGIPHATDGHAGTIVRTWREHTMSTDDAFLRSVWPRVKRAMQFMIDQDAGRGFFESRVPEHARNTEPDGILEGPQYNTLDRWWVGEIPWTSGLYLAALRATSEMAREMGDDAFADECQQIADRGMVALTEATFNEKFGYFVQNVPDDNTQINVNDGCHIDQVFGQSMALQVGLPRVLPEAETRSALASLFEHNLYREVGDYRRDAFVQCGRFFADDDEPGFFICTFPNGGAETSTNEGGVIGGYFTECMTGFTYQVASHMIDEGMVTEGLALNKAIDDRYAEAPLRRNPFNEIEYGNHYSRAMASYASYISLSGFTYHGPHGEIGFAPKLHPEDFRTAFVVAEGWGTYAQTVGRGGMTAQLELDYGQLTLNQITLQTEQDAANVQLNGVAVQAEVNNGQIVFDSTITLNAGDVLSIDFE